MGTAGTGGSTHVAGELFQMMTDTKFTHVPYRGSPPAIADLMAGQIQVMFDNLTASIALIRAGRLKPLAVSMRTAALPDVPLISDFVPGYEAYSWNGITAPRDCPRAIVAKLNAAVNAIVADADFKAKLADVANTPMSDTPEGFGKLIDAGQRQMGQGGAVRRDHAVAAILPRYRGAGASAASRKRPCRVGPADEIPRRIPSPPASAARSAAVGRRPPCCRSSRPPLWQAR